MTSSYEFDDYTIDLAREEDGSYLAEVVEMPGCLAAGEDPNETIALLRDSFDLWTAEAMRAGRSVPPPTREGPSGRLLLRLPKSLHVRVAQAAALDGVSVNAFVTAAIAERVGTGRARSAQG